MSDFTGLTVICFFGTTGLLLTYYITNSANNLGVQILTGVIGGTPVSIGARRALLFQMWLPHQIGGVATAVFLAFGAARIADHVGDEDIKLLAYFLAFGDASLALLVLSNTVFGVRNYERMLRRIERK
jgi:hypothetical protein